MKSFENRISEVQRLLDGAECVLIGGGSGLSSAAGLEYAGGRFKRNFSDFIKKYGVRDMYSAGFYPFETQEEKWAYWSKHVFLNRYEPPALELYQDIFKLIYGKNYFVITTNVDFQFYKAGFGAENIFAVQGDYGKFQCAKGCHEKLYGNEEAITAMCAAQKDCRIPSLLVPKCPICGGNMEVNIRKDFYFTEDDGWRAQSKKFDAFVQKALQSRTVLLEFGVGFNTPTIIRFPFEQITFKNENAHLVRVNKDFPEPINENANKTVSFPEDATKVVRALK